MKKTLMGILSVAVVVGGIWGVAARGRQIHDGSIDTIVTYYDDKFNWPVDNETANEVLGDLIALRNSEIGSASELFSDDELVHWLDVYSSGRN